MHDEGNDGSYGEDGDFGGDDQGGRPGEVEIREQDRFLPVANIARIMKKVLPNNAKIAKDAKEGIQECLSEFISFITSEASDKCQQEKRKTINGDDLLWAMSALGFDKYIDPLKTYLTKYRESVKGDKPEKKPPARPKDPQYPSMHAQPKAPAGTMMMGLGSSGMGGSIGVESMSDYGGYQHPYGSSSSGMMPGPGMDQSMMLGSGRPQLPPMGRMSVESGRDPNLMPPSASYSDISMARSNLANTGSNLGLYGQQSQMISQQQQSQQQQQQTLNSQQHLAQHQQQMGVSALSQQQQHPQSAAQLASHTIGQPSQSPANMQPPQLGQQQSHLPISSHLSIQAQIGQNQLQPQLGGPLSQQQLPQPQGNPSMLKGPAPVHMSVPQAAQLNSAHAMPSQGQLMQMQAQIHAPTAQLPPVSQQQPQAQQVQQQTQQQPQQQLQQQPQQQQQPTSAQQTPGQFEPFNST